MNYILGLVKRYQFSLLLLGILLIGTVLRIYRLDTLPPSLEWDEVATGYDAYSILRTGRDQFGHFLPLTFRSIDDYKPPLYTYMAVVSIAFFGWNDFAVRFPAALLGILTIYTTYGMTYSLFQKRKLALISALLLTISPWHVNFSRLALETNSTIFFTTAGVWAFLTGLKNGKYLIISALFIGLDLYLYHNARVFIPLFGLGLVLLYGKDLRYQRWYTLISIIIFAVFVIRLIPIVTSIEGQMRFNGTSIFTPAVPEGITVAKTQYAERRLIDDQMGISVYGKVFNNIYVLFALRIFKNYLTHFDPNFWVFTSDYPRHHMPEMGLIYFIELPLFFLGIYFLLQGQNIKNVMIVILWFLLAPVSASVTRDVPHALRSEIFLPTFQIFIAAAIIRLVDILKNRKYLYKLCILFFSIIYFVHVSFFLEKFLFHFARETSQDWLYGRKETVQYLETIKQNYDRIIVSTAIDQPHVFWLYYTQYDPMLYQNEGGTVSGGWAETRNRFDKYEFKPLGMVEYSVKKILLVGLPKEFGPGDKVIQRFYYLNGKEAIRVVER